MIKIDGAGHWSIAAMTVRELDSVASTGELPPAAVLSPERRLRVLVDLHYDFVWRTVRYLGVPDSAAEDAAQQVLFVLARRLDDVVPGAELSFLFGTAVRVVKDIRRTGRRKPATPDPDVDAFVAPDANPEDLLARRRALDELQRILDALPEELRAVFVLFEIEELTMAEVALVLGIPAGTAASRLRKARDAFERIVARKRAAARRMNGGDHG